MPGIDSYTKLLLHLDVVGTTFADSSTAQAAKTQSAIGNGQISAAQSKFGGASYLGDGSGDGISSPDHADFNMGTGDFTVDCWARFIDKTATVTLFARGADHFLFNWNGVDTITIIVMSDSKAISWSPNNGQWYHIAFVRSGTDVMLFIDGVQTGTTLTSSANVTETSKPFYIGIDSDGSGRSWNGYIDEFRVSKGIARWTANFTPPTIPYSTNKGFLMALID